MRKSPLFRYGLLKYPRFFHSVSYINTMASQRRRYPSINRLVTGLLIQNPYFKSNGSTSLKLAGLRHGLSIIAALASLNPVRGLGSPTGSAARVGIEPTRFPVGLLSHLTGTDYAPKMRESTVERTIPPTTQAVKTKNAPKGRNVAPKRGGHPPKEGLTDGKRGEVGENP
jgi:hypothetical protein